MRSSIALLALVPSALAHFKLNYPVPLVGEEEQEATAPCGGATITFAANDTDLTVEGFQIAARTTHPEANWLFRATLSTQEPFNWTNILPVVSQSGLGDFCMTNLTLPSEFVGHQGLVQVSQGGDDGQLYQVGDRDTTFPSLPLISSSTSSLTFFLPHRQCAPVNFVQGSTLTLPSVCTNASGVEASITTATSLTDESDSSSSTSSATASAASSTASAGSAVRQAVGGLLAMVPAGLLLL